MTEEHTGSVDQTIETARRAFTRTSFDPSAVADAYGPCPVCQAWVLEVPLDVFPAQRQAYIDAEILAHLEECVTEPVDVPIPGEPTAPAEETPEEPT